MRKLIFVFAVLFLGFSLKSQASCNHNPGVVTVKLSKGPCFGECPVYDVTVHQNGEVEYQGDKFVKVMGLKKYKITKANSEDLFNQFKKSDFLNLKDYYKPIATDMPRYRICYYDGSREKEVGFSFHARGMPPFVPDLAKAIDAVAGTQGLTGK